MNTGDIIKHLRTSNKPYNHIDPVMAQSTFSNTLRAIENGTAKLSTIKSFMKRFGFEFVNMKWSKKELIEKNGNSILIEYGVPDSEGNVFMPGCFDKSLGR